MLKLEYHVQFMGILAGIQLCLFRRYAGCLAYGHDIVFGQYLFVHFLKIFVDIRTMNAEGTKITI